MLSIGSNLGDRMKSLRSVAVAMRPHLQLASGVWQTPPWGPVEQDDYLNAVLVVSDPAADAAEWLRRAQACERAAGRVRDVRWGPRTLDVDVVTVEGVRQNDPDLTLPHPRAHERAFVLLPWLDADPAAELAGHGTVADLVESLPVDERAGVRRVADESWAN